MRQAKDAIVTSTHDGRHPDGEHSDARQAAPAMEAGR
ncbi:hypothetical protein FHU30_008512 [Actinomadura rupiterrae]|nr:hypothetical protein [Actinomadura rupiterrae]